MRISAWSSDVCSSDLRRHRPPGGRNRAAVAVPQAAGGRARHQCAAVPARLRARREPEEAAASCYILKPAVRTNSRLKINDLSRLPFRSEEHTSELQSLMRISYAVFCLKKKITED